MTPTCLQNALAHAIIALLAGATVGCSQAEPERLPVFKTTGQITFQNRPPAGALVVLHPRGAAPDAPRPIAHVRADGSFEATTYGTADGAPAGEYVVTVQWSRLVNLGGEWQPGPNVLPAKYASPATSDVIIQVVEGSNELSPIILR